MTCPKCGYTPRIGRPRVLDDARVMRWYRRGWPIARIAKKFGVSKPAIAQSLRRAAHY